MRKLIPLLGLVLVGCEVNPGQNPDPGEISGTVTIGTKPVNGVNLNLQPTGTGTQAVIAVRKGEFTGTVTPGKYTYYFTENSKTPASHRIPEKYQSGSMDRQITIGAGEKLMLTMD